MIAIFFLHCSRFFDTEGWHLKNAEQSFIVVVVKAGLIWVWVMQLFFLISGAASWYALSSRITGAYLLERVKRLLVPLYTVGMLILLPPQVYFELFTNMKYTGTFWELILRYFVNLPAEIIGIAPYDLYDARFLVPFGFPGHLWFLQYLFLISLMILPLLLYLKSERGQGLIEKLVELHKHQGGIFLFVIPLAIVLISLRFPFKSERSWADFLWYMIFFIIGYIVAADRRFTESFIRYRWNSLMLWIAGFGGVCFFVLALGYNPYPGNEPFSFIYVLFQISWSIASWGAVVFMLSLGARYLNFNNKILVYGNEAVLPFYIFHQTIILSVGWFVIPLSLGILPKFLIISVISFPLIIILYELLVRHFNIVRFFFGMRPKKQLVKERTAGPG